MRRAAPASFLTLVAGLSVVTVAVAHAQDVRVAARVVPPAVHLGETARYVARALLPHGSYGKPRWLPPDSSQALTWGPLRARFGPGAGGAPDTLMVMSTVQGFTLGPQTIPGLGFIDDTRTPRVVQHVPTTVLTIQSLMTAADTNPQLHGVRGPLRAPWWERVPWLWVAIALLVIAAIVVLIVAWRRRRRTGPVRVPAVARSPGTVALERLAALRAKRLPEAGAFPEHAFELTAILRRFLEATGGGAKPGDTTSDLARRFAAGGATPMDAKLLVELLRGWDRVKFARAPITIDDARRSESAVEEFVRRRMAPVERPAEAA